MGGHELVGPAPAGWGYTTLGAACEKGGGDIQTGPFGSQLHAADYVPVGIPSIMPSNIGDNRIVEDGIARITPEDAKRLGRYLVRPGDIVYSRRGDVERRALVRDLEDGWLCGTGCLRVRFGQGGADPQYAAYYLGDPRVRGWIVRHAHGATMPNLNTSILSACPFLVPPPGEQRAIAHILGTLDDKIELNRRMSATLEAMARALFKSWFVDFDPVRAKMDGRWLPGESISGLPADMYELFPEQLVESELGEVPEGWQVVGLSEVVDINPNRRLQKGVTAPYLEMANMPTRGHVPEVIAERPYGSGMRFMNGDTLLARITPCLENGKTAYVDFLDDGQVGWGSTEYIVLRSKSSLPEQFTYCLARHEPFRQFAIQSMTGSSGRQRVRTSALEHYRLPVPPQPQLGQFFQKSTAPLFERAAECTRESRVLAGLRDTLLPKLISGELRVPAAEELVEEAVS